MDIIKKINFIEKNSSFFMDKGYEKINDKDNVLITVLIILLSDKELEQCDNYSLLIKKINNYNTYNNYYDFTQVICNLKHYVVRILNYSNDSIIINKKLNNIIDLYKKSNKVKKYNIS